MRLNFCNIILFKFYKNYKLNDEHEYLLRANKFYFIHMFHIRAILSG